MLEPIHLVYFCTFVLDFLNIHFHPDPDGYEFDTYVKKPSSFDKYNIIEFDVTTLKGIKNTGWFSDYRKEFNGYRYWIDIDTARQILNDFKKEIFYREKTFIELLLGPSINREYHSDASHRIEGYSTEDLNNRLWELSGSPRSVEVLNEEKLKESNKGILEEINNKPQIINSSSNEDLVGSAYTQEPLNVSTNVDKKGSSPSSSSSMETIDWNNIPSWLINKLSKYFRETGNKNIEIEKLKDIFSQELLSGALSKEDIVDLQNYYVCLFNDGSNYSVEETNDKSRLGNLGSFGGSVGSNLDQPLNLLGKSILSASSKALEKSSTLADVSERTYNLAYGAYELGGPLLDEPMNMAADLASQSSTMASYGARMAVVGKAIPYIGSVIGIGVDLNRENRISKVEGAVSSVKGITDNLSSNLSIIDKRMTSHLEKTREIQQAVINVKGTIDSHSEKFVEIDVFKDKMLEELNENSEVINTIVAKTGISVQLDNFNSKMEDLNLLSNKMKENEERRRLEAEERDRKFVENIEKIHRETEEALRQIDEREREDQARRERENREWEEHLAYYRARDNNPLLFLKDLYNWFSSFKFKRFTLIGIGVAGYIITFPWLRDFYYLAYRLIDVLFKFMIVKPSRTFIGLFESEETKLNPPETVVSSIIKPFASIYDRLILTRNFVEHRIVKVRTIVKLVKYSIVLLTLSIVFGLIYYFSSKIYSISYGISTFLISLLRSLYGL